MRFRALTLFVVAVVLTALTAAPASAAAPAASAAPLLAGYWTEFVDHWAGVIQKQNGVIMAGLLLGAVCLFIITRGKWRK